MASQVTVNLPFTLLRLAQLNAQGLLGCPLVARAPGPMGRVPPSRGGAPPGLRAPARGVDVKPPRQIRPGGPKSPKNRVFGLYPAKRRFFAILAKNGYF